VLLPTHLSNPGLLKAGAAECCCVSVKIYSDAMPRTHEDP
jgi:hypothetical protein